MTFCTECVGPRGMEFKWQPPVVESSSGNTMPFLGKKSGVMVSFRCCNGILPPFRVNISMTSRKEMVSSASVPGIPKGSWKRVKILHLKRIWQINTILFWHFEELHQKGSNLHNRESGVGLEHWQDDDDDHNERNRRSSVWRLDLLYGQVRHRYHHRLHLLGHCVPFATLKIQFNLIFNSPCLAPFRWLIFHKFAIQMTSSVLNIMRTD